MSIQKKDGLPMERMLCAICNQPNKMPKLVVCKPCFNKVMSTKQGPIPALFAEWSKDDAV